MDWVLIEVPAVMGGCFYFLDRRLKRLEGQINNGLTTKVQKLAIDMAFLRGQFKGDKK